MESLRVSEQCLIYPDKARSHIFEFDSPQHLGVSLKWTKSNRWPYTGILAPGTGRTYDCSMSNRQGRVAQGVNLESSTRDDLNDSQRAAVDFGCCDKTSSRAEDRYEGRLLFLMHPAGVLVILALAPGEPQGRQSVGPRGS